MEKQLRLLSIYKKQPGLFDALFAIASLVFMILVTGKDLLGGGDAYKYFIAILRLVIPLCLFLYIGFFHSLIRFTLSRTSLWLNIFSAVSAVGIGFSLTSAFDHDFFSGLRNGGGSPVRLRTMLDLLHLSNQSESILFTVLSVFLFLFVCYFLFFLILFFLEALLLFLRNLRNEPEADTFQPANPIRTRLLIASGFAIVSFTLCFFTLNKGQDWGADYALYMNQAFALARGEVTNISEVWGFSLVLSWIYRLFGYDMGDYHTFLYYKIPGILAFAVAMFFLYLFFSKRFSLVKSAFFTALFALNPFFINFSNYIFTDLPYLLWCIVSILCMERYFNSKTVPQKVVFAVLTGITVFLANFTRAAGMSLLATMLLIDLFNLVSSMFRRSGPLPQVSNPSRISRILMRLLPYAVYGVLLLVSYSVVPFNANTTSISRYSSASVFAQNFVYYASILFDQFPMSVSPYEIFHFFVYWIVVPLFLLGVVRSAKREKIALVYFSITYLAMHFVNALNGIRYAFPILFVFLLFLAYGADFAYRTLYRVFSSKKVFRVSCRVVSILIVCFLFYSSVATAWINMAEKRAFNHFAFSTDAIATYHYIQKNTPEDAKIVFYKSEVIRLNTNRASTSSIDPTDTSDQYLLITYDRTPEHQYLPDEYPDVDSLEKALNVTLLLKYQNPLFTLYRIL